MKRSSTTQGLLSPPELTLLLALAEVLIRTSCRKDAVAIALHPPRWVRRNVVKKTPDGAQRLLPSTPLLRRITKRLVATAKRFLTTKSWSRKKVARDAGHYLTLRATQHAPANELLAIQAFVKALACVRRPHRPKPTSRPPVSFHGMGPTSDGVYMNHNARGW